MAVTIGSGPMADFGRPLQLMKECHRRVEHFLDVLIRVAGHPGPLDEEQRRALETSLRYFHEAAPRHTEDEERSLFPRLRQSRDAEALAALATMDALESDHVAAQELHQRVEAAGSEWLADGELPAGCRAEIRSDLDQLRTLYQRHIKVEDEQLYPAAGRVLSDAELAEIGREMQQRRALHPGREGSRCAEKRRAMQDGCSGA